MKIIFDKDRAEKKYIILKKISKVCDFIIKICRIFAVSYIVLIAMGFFLLEHLNPYITKTLILVTLGVGFVLILFCVVFLLAIVLELIYDQSCSMQYYISYKDKKVLDYEVFTTSNLIFAEVSVVYEDEDNVVRKEKLTNIFKTFSFKCILKTDISETTIDLDKRIVYIPYEQIILV